MALLFASARNLALARALISRPLIAGTGYGSDFRDAKDAAAFRHEHDTAQRGTARPKVIVRELQSVTNLDLIDVGIDKPLPAFEVVDAPLFRDLEVIADLHPGNEQGRNIGSQDNADNSPAATDFLY
jgi:hypothetical protein